MKEIQENLLFLSVNTGVLDELDDVERPEDAFTFDFDGFLDVVGDLVLFLLFLVLVLVILVAVVRETVLFFLPIGINGRSFKGVLYLTPDVVPSYQNNKI